MHLENQKINLTFAVLGAMLAGCGGGGSGVDGDKPITELSTSEVRAVCSWTIDALGGEGHTGCCDKDTACLESYEVGTVAECVAAGSQTPESCRTVTVAELESCIKVVSDDLCRGWDSPACAEYAQCGEGGDSGGGSEGDDEGAYEGEGEIDSCYDACDDTVNSCYEDCANEQYYCEISCIEEQENCLAGCKDSSCLAECDDNLKSCFGSCKTIDIDNCNQECTDEGNPCYNSCDA